MGKRAGRLSCLMGKPGISSENLALESCLLEWREKVLPNIRLEFPDPELKPEQVIAALLADRPVAELVTQIPNVKVIQKAAAEFLKSITSINTFKNGFKPWFDHLPDGAAEIAEDERITDWFAYSWQGDRAGHEKLALATGMDPDLLAWAGNQLTRPFFHRLGELLAAHQPAEGPPKLTVGCPCCGGPPRLGRYARNEGQRYLWCDLCNIQWAFRRVTCAFCLNTEHEKLGFLTVDGIEHYRIDVCKACSGYLRSIDERDLPEDHRTDYLLEDVGTLHLSMAAEKDGWQQGVILSGAVPGQKWDG
ncbi:MAG: formate dehydrogenase accessory protein FdhE [Candidatus Eisenbacteria bacterium]|nr:formate dehydrogenase accessory protein FdhE [Candidatus Eisenbacteria bacterium]